MKENPTNTSGSKTPNIGTKAEDALTSLSQAFNNHNHPTTLVDLFNEFVERRIGHIREQLQQKGKEYRTDNPFHNFDEAAKIKGETPEQALWGMMMKHFVSVQDLIYERKKFTQEQISEKFGDLINYLVIAEIMYHLKNEIYE